MFEIEQFNQADDNFTNILIGTMELAYEAYDVFKYGAFDRFINLSKIEEWRARKDSNPQPSDP